LRLIPGTADGRIKPFYLATTELMWEAADAYIYALDEERNQPPPGGPDAVTRPSKPYLPPDRGFGHEGFPAITMSFQNAQQFCAWLTTHASVTSKRTFRLPTEAEWEHAATGGGSPFLPGELEDVAWFAGNSNGAPQRVGTKVPGAWGLRDMLGNVQEWCVAQDGAGVTRGGSYRDGPEKVNTTHREPYNRAWNASDPQIPKSRWWLADGPFVGFRVVCEVE
jgi:formylglycine-generating enzyme required for sulfatase activity